MDYTLSVRTQCLPVDITSVVGWILFTIGFIYSRDVFFSMFFAKVFLYESPVLPRFPL